MTTIKSFTDFDQSKKLSEFLTFESADMVHFGIHQGIDGEYHLSGINVEEDIVPIYKNLCTKVFTETTTSDIICMLPCWSLSVLLDILPKGTRLLKSATNDTYYCDCPKGNIDKWFNNPVDACVEMIINLCEHDLL